VPAGRDLEALIDAAREVRRNAHAPYSGFPVGAAVLAGERVFVGVNVENASYPVSSCAERNALAASVAAGATDVDAVAVVAGEHDAAPPCGACRQALVELAPRAVVVAESADGRRRTWAAGELLPDAFDAASLRSP
jgi:cytidine deaminase